MEIKRKILNESDSSSEGENGEDENIDNWKFGINFILIIYNY